MSDPMTNTEVEDVLASIRRLVSDDHRPEAKPVEKAVADRLVLTPSLRVMEDDRTGAPEPDIAVEIDAQVEHEQQDTSPLYKALDPTLEGDDHWPHNVAHAVPAQEEGAQGAVGTPLTPVQEDDANTQEHAFADDVHDAVESAVIEMAAQPAVADSADAQVADDFGDADLSEASSDPDDTPNAHTDFDASPVAEGLDDIAATEEVVMEDAPFVLADAIDDLAGLDEKPVTPVAQTLSEKVAALETLVGKRSDNFEPDDLNVGANAGTEPPAMEWEDAELDANEAPEYGDAAVDETPEYADSVADDAPAYAAFVGAQSKAEPEETASQLFSGDEEVVDEEALRELISNIVREELQGALGERITRNVRKLVRREIHRALAAQDLE